MFCIVALSHTSAVSFSDSNCRLLFSPVNSQPKGLMERSSRPLHLFCQTRSAGIAGTAASMKAGVLQARIHSQYPARKIFMALTATRQTVKKVEGGSRLYLCSSHQVSGIAAWKTTALNPWALHKLETNSKMTKRTIPTGWNRSIALVNATAGEDSESRAWLHEV